MLYLNIVTNYLNAMRQSIKSYSNTAERDDKVSCSCTTHNGYGALNSFCFDLHKKCIPNDFLLKVEKISMYSATIMNLH